MRATIDQGLQELQQKQGSDGLPQAPPSAKAPPTAAQYAALAPPPEANLDSEIQQTDQLSDQAEKDVTAETAQDGGGAPVSVTLGQTTDEVQAAMGEPTRVTSKGSKTTYYYDDRKITFKDGRVSEVN